MLEGERETGLVLDTHRILCTLEVFSSSKLLPLTAHILYTFANRNLSCMLNEVENGEAGGCTLYSGVLNWNVYRVHSAVSGMEAKRAMQSSGVGHKGLQFRRKMQCSARYNFCNAPSAGCVGECGVRPRHSN